MKRLIPILTVAAALAMTSCGGSKSEPNLTKSGLDPANFVAEVDGKTTGLYTLKNDAGMEVCITNYGGRIVSIMVPDREGQFRDVVLGFDSIASYLPENNQTDFGAAIGRYANRIKDGKFVLNGDTVKLPTNIFGHTLHGGPTGWQYQVYEVKEATDSTLSLVMNSPAGDNGFPGAVTATVEYRLDNENALHITYTGQSDSPTVYNPTNHSYFNLNADPSKPITDNVLYVLADGYTPVDSTFMTTGEIAAVSGTPFDFKMPHAIGDSIDVDFVQIKNGNGYDHNWVLATGGKLDVLASKLVSPSTGIGLEVYTNEPGIQIYTGNFLDGTVTGKNGKVYNKRAAICLETQKYPNTPNNPQWPSATLNPGQTITSQCIFKFTVEK